VVSDTAGLRESPDPIEKEGIEMAYEEIKSSNAVVVILDISSFTSDNNYTLSDEHLCNLIDSNPNAIILLNKRDSVTYTVD